LSDRDGVADLWAQLGARRRTMPRDAVFAGFTAAWMHGLEVRSIERIEIALPPTCTVRSCVGVIVRRSRLSAEEITQVRGFRATTLHRTLRDLCLFGDPLDALVAIDMAMNKKRTDVKRLLGDRVTAKGRRGSARLRRLVQLAAPAESPMETRLRWLLVSAGLPQSEVQVDLHDDDGEFLGRADLYYRQARLVIEYDGVNHRERLVSDDRRQNLLINAGYRILRFTAADIRGRPEIVVAQVRGSI